MSDEKKEAKSTEFPKSMYKGGEREGAHVIVAGPEEEKAARKQGFAMIDKDNEKASIARRAAEDKALEEASTKGKK